MLNRLHIRNFTVFADADFEFGPGLNVLVGTNGTGKSHVLKLGYVMLHDTLHDIQEHNGDTNNQLEDSTNINSIEVLDKLRTVFQPVPFQSGVLIRRSAKVNTATVDVSMHYSEGWVESGLVFHHFEDWQEPTVHQNPVVIWKAEANKRVSPTVPVFIPAKEVLTMGWMLALYDRREIPLDETYPDLLRLLAVPPLKRPGVEINKILNRLLQLIGGKVDEEGGRYYLSAPKQPRLEMNLVAEGLRKFAILYKLLANGTLTSETTLFWDEPEANLNPALLKEMAAILAEMAREGFQIILATHSLFLLKEFHILSQQEQLPLRYFGLSAEAGGATEVATADALTDLPNLVALDVEMAQSDAFLDVLNRDDANV